MTTVTSKLLSEIIFQSLLAHAPSIYVHFYVVIYLEGVLIKISFTSVEA